MPKLIRDGFSDLFYDEVVKNTPSPEYYLLPGAARARRVIDVDWNDLDKAIKMFLGFPVVKEGGPYGRYLHRLIPSSIKSIKSTSSSTESGVPYLFASQIERVEPISARGDYDLEDVAQYIKARLYIIYEAPTYPIRVDTDDLVSGEIDPEFPDESRLNRYITPTYKPSAEFLNLPRGTIFKWVDGKKGGIDFATNVITPSVEIQLNWHQVPVLSESRDLSNPTNETLITSLDGLPTATKTHVGKVNRRTFLGKPPGTLLLAGVDTRRYKLATGTPVWDINYRIKYFDPSGDGRGHNWFLHYNVNVTQTLPFPQVSPIRGYKSPVDRYEMTTTGEPSNRLDWGDFGTKPMLDNSPIPIFGYAEFDLLFQPI